MQEDIFPSDLFSDELRGNVWVETGGEASRRMCVGLEAEVPWEIALGQVRREGSTEL